MAPQGSQRKRLVKRRPKLAKVEAVPLSALSELGGESHKTWREGGEASAAIDDVTAAALLAEDERLLKQLDALRLAQPSMPAMAPSGSRG